MSFVSIDIKSIPEHLRSLVNGDIVAECKPGLDS
jgi:hypothetical protein